MTPFCNGIYTASKELLYYYKKNINLSETLNLYCLCWLGSVFIFFSISATKLPSYWLPATPAAAILISNSFSKLKNISRKISYIEFFTILSLFGLSISFFLSNIWLSWINDPEMPNLSADLVSSGIILRARIIFSFLAIASLLLNFAKSKNILPYIQILLLLGYSFLMPPIRRLADQSRQLPLRNISNLILNVREGKEALAMIGVRKPSLHFYSKQIVFYEAGNREGLINLSERLDLDRRENYQDKPNYDYKSILVVIDKYSSFEDPWSNINHQKLGQFGIYNLWRIKKRDLNKKSEYLVDNGYSSDWKNRKVEKF